MDDLQAPISRKFGPYITLKLIGTGGQSAVYNAMHETTGRMVALRIMSISDNNISEALNNCKDVLAELRILDIPNAVMIEDFGNIEAVLYIAMSVMTGGTLLERMRQRHFFSAEEHPTLPSPLEVLELVERMAVALDSLHSIGMVHGQVEPRSIMFNNRGEAFLSDIGMTRMVKFIYKLDATNSFNMTKYSAPELWEGKRPSPATDQYAFACIVYELLTGKAPFDAPSIFGLMQAHANDVAAPPHYVREGLPSSLAMIFWQALAKPVDRRYPRLIDFYDDLRESLYQHDSKATGFFTFEVD
jgi:serine/threonine protein kinase, bacterial